MDVYRISAITLRVQNMRSSYEFYSRLPGFRLAHGGPSERFTSFQVGGAGGSNSSSGGDSSMYLNLELAQDAGARDFGRVIFHTRNVDELYRYMASDASLSNSATLEGEPQDASWGERFFHVRDPDGYELSFAKPL